MEFGARGSRNVFFFFFLVCFFPLAYSAYRVNVASQTCIKKITKQLDHGSRMLLPETKVIAIEVLGITLPRTPSFPILAGISEEVIEKRYQVLQFAKPSPCSLPSRDCQAAGSSPSLYLCIRGEADLTPAVAAPNHQVEKNTDAWRNQMVRHYKTILGYRMSPYFIRCEGALGTP